MIVLRNKQYSLEEKDFTFKRQMKYLIGKGRVKVAGKLHNLALKNQNRQIDSIKQLQQHIAEKNSTGENYKEVAKKLYQEASKLGARVVDPRTVRLHKEAGGACTFKRNQETNKLVNKVIKENKKGKKIQESPKKYMIYLDKGQKASRHPAILAHEMGHLTPAKRYGGRPMADVAGLIPSANPNWGVLPNWIVNKIRLSEEKRASNQGLKYLKKAGISKKGMQEAKELMKKAYNTYRYGNKAQLFEDLSDKVTIPSRTRKGIAKRNLEQLKREYERQIQEMKRKLRGFE